MATRGGLGKKHTILLQALCYLTQKQLREILRIIDSSLIRSICECALNVLHGNVNLKVSERRRLRRYAVLLRRLAEKRGNWKAKRHLIVNRCTTFLKLLLIPVLNYFKNGTCEKNGTHST